MRWVDSFGSLGRILFIALSLAACGKMNVAEPVGHVTLSQERPNFGEGKTVAHVTLTLKKVGEAYQEQGQRKMRLFFEEKTIPRIERFIACYEGCATLTETVGFFYYYIDLKPGDKLALSGVLKHHGGNPTLQLTRIEKRD